MASTSSDTPRLRVSLSVTGIESSSTAIPARNAGSRSVITPAPNTLIESLASSECSRWLFGTARSVKMTESGAET